MGVIEGAAAVVRSLFGPSASGPLGWIDVVNREKPAGYDADVEALFAYYSRRTRGDTREQLARHFVETHDKMIPVGLPVVPKIVRELAQTFAGDGQSFDLYAGEDKVEEAGPRKWADILTAADLLATLVTIDRLTVALGRVFVRVGWDETAGAVALTVFRPDRVWPRFEGPDGHRNLSAAKSILAEVAPTFDASGNRKRRFEKWFEGKVQIVDEDDRILSTSDTGLRDEITGEPILPWVDFRSPDALPDVDWPSPNEDLLDAARAVNVQLTNEFHILTLQSFGQWLAQQTQDNAEQWKGKIKLGPDRVPKVPRGWSLTHQEQRAPLEMLRGAREGYLRHLSSFEGLPAGSVLTEDRQVPTGVALEIERRPLIERREDSVRRAKRSVELLLKMIRLSWNTYGAASDAERFRGVREEWCPGTLRGPQDPMAKIEVDAAAIDLGTLSVVEVLMRDEGLTREAAVDRAAQIRAENGPKQAPAMAAALGLAKREPMPMKPEDVPEDDAEDPEDGKPVEE